MSHMPRFDPERHARRLCQAGLPLVVVGLYFGGPVGWPAALLGVGLLLLACYSGRDGFLLVGPFAKSELVRAARRRRPQLVRGVIAAAAGVMIFNTLENAGGIGDAIEPSRLAAANTLVTVWLAFGVAVAVLAQTALLVPGVVSDERAGRRWDVLMATDLRSREIVYGKLLGRLPSIFEPVLVVLPILAILPILGGVPALGALLYLVMLAATVLALAGVGAFHSLFAKDAGTAARRSLGLVVLYLMLSSGLLLLHLRPDIWTFPRWQGWDAAPAQVADLVELANMANPFGAFWFANDRRPAGAPYEAALVDAACVYLAGAAGVFLAFSLLAVRRLRSAVPWAGKAPARAARAEAQVLAHKRRTAAARPPVSDLPLTWWVWYGPGGATWHINLGGRRGIAVGFVQLVSLFLAAYAVDLVGQRLPITWGLWPYRPTQQWPFVTVVRVVLLVGLFCMSLACQIVPLFRAAACIARERAADTLEPVNLTPLSGREIVYQKWFGCATAERGTWYAVWLVALAGTVTGFVHPLTLLGLTVVVPVAAGALAAVGMVFTVRAKTPAKATRNMVLTIVFGGYVLALVGAGLVAGVAQLTGNMAVVRWFDEPILLPVVLPPAAVVFAVLPSADGFNQIDTETVVTAAGGIALGLIVWAGVGYAAFNLAVRRFDRGRAA